MLTWAISFPDLSLPLSSGIGAEGSGIIQNRYQKTQAVRNQQKHLEFTLPRKRLLFTRETVHMSMNTSPNTLVTFKLRRIKSNKTFFQSKQISVVGVTQVTIRKFKMLFFQKQKRYGTGRL